MTDRERAICSRVRLIREDLKWSQIDFAKALRITRPKLSAIEYEHTPVRFDLASTVSTTFDISLGWLITGEGDMRPCNYGAFIWTVEDWDKMGRNPLLTALFDYQPWKFYPQPKSKAPGGPIPENYDFRRVFVNWLRWTLSGIDFKDRYAARDFIDRCTQSIRAHLRKPLARGQAFRIERNEANAENEITALTHIIVSDNTNDVKAQWPLLKARLQKATSEKGSKSRLAEFLGLPLSSVSLWLSNSKSAREPGAETALRMLYWVEHREHK